MVPCENSLFCPQERLLVHGVRDSDDRISSFGVFDEPEMFFFLLLRFEKFLILQVGGRDARFSLFMYFLTYTSGCVEKAVHCSPEEVWRGKGGFAAFHFPRMDRALRRFSRRQRRRRGLSWANRTGSTGTRLRSGAFSFPPRLWRLGRCLPASPGRCRGRRCRCRSQCCRPQ